VADTKNTEEESSNPSASDEEALEMFEKLKGNMANKA